MGGYVTAIWGWDEQAQRDFHARAFSPHRWQIITVGGADIGMIDVEYRPGEIYLARIEVCPGHQGHGIGTRIISALSSAASALRRDSGIFASGLIGDRGNGRPGAGSSMNRGMRCVCRWGSELPRVS